MRRKRRKRREIKILRRIFKVILVIYMIRIANLLLKGVKRLMATPDITALQDEVAALKQADSDMKGRIKTAIDKLEETISNLENQLAGVLTQDQIDAITADVKGVKEDLAGEIPDPDNPDS